MPGTIENRHHDDIGGTYTLHEGTRFRNGLAVSIGIPGGILGIDELSEAERCRIGGEIVPVECGVVVVHRLHYDLIHLALVVPDGENVHFLVHAADFVSAGEYCHS